MVYLGDTYHMETSQLFRDANQMEWDLSGKLQPSVSTYNLHPPIFPFLVALQTLIEVFVNGNPYCIVFKSSIRITDGVKT